MFRPNPDLLEAFYHLEAPLLFFFNAKQPPDDQQRYSVTDKTEVKVVATAEERGQILPPTSVTVAASF